jgi:hypothetical protein
LAPIYALFAVINEVITLETEGTILRHKRLDLQGVTKFSEFFELNCPHAIAEVKGIVVKEHL